VVEEEEEVIVEEEVEEEEEVIVEEEEEETAPTANVPKYGGVLKIGQRSDITHFCVITGQAMAARTAMVTNEGLWAADWTRGPAGGYGTSESDWSGSTYAGEKLRDGRIAESWELPKKIEGETATVIWNIRKGIYWALNPASEASSLVGGRELTADDVVFTLDKSTNYSGAYLYRGNPELRVAKITSPEPWTVKMEVPWDSLASALERFGEFARMMPPEVWDKYGDMKNWKNNVGTGPFMLTDVVVGSSLTMMRNTNYWMEDPIGPGKGNQLPYMDSVKYLVIPDASTVYAALRTGKLDWLGKGAAGFGVEISREDAVELKNTTPELMSKRIALSDSSGTIALKLDKEPFNDIKVRQALMMATDFETIKKEYFDGEAQIVPSSRLPPPRQTSFSCLFLL
ncbi:ABC transporter substrate-binding protein, partial [Chloroflexota bacterium]